MKNTLLIVLILIFSCQEKKKEIISETSIAKEKLVEKRDEVVISVNDTITSFFTNLYVDEIQDKPDMLTLGKETNKISIVIPTDKTIEIIGGDPFISFLYKLKIERGDSLLIDIDKVEVNHSKKVNYPIFTIPNSHKKWSELNFDYLLYKMNIVNEAIVIDPEDNFLNNVYDSEKVYQNSIKLLDSLKESNNISNDFYTTTKITQKLKFARSKINNTKKEELNIEDLAINLNDEKLLNNSEYISFLRTLITHKYFYKDKRALYSTQFDYINNNDTFLNNNAKQVLLDAYLKSIFILEKSKFNEYLTKFNKINTNKSLEGKWLSLIEKQKSNSKKLNKTNRNIGVLTNLINDNEFLFEEILANNKGKIVLVDFWASWCAPCRAEMPYLKNLKSKFNKANFNVIEISIDKDYSAWKRASKLENLSKEQDNYIIANWEKSNLYQNYKINSIPRYLLFGKDGKIISDDAPRPSVKELEELIRINI